METMGIDELMQNVNDVFRSTLLYPPTLAGKWCGAVSYLRKTRRGYLHEKKFAKPLPPIPEKLRRV